jgi:hypothetical protein
MAVIWGSGHYTQNPSGDGKPVELVFFFAQPKRGFGPWGEVPLALVEPDRVCAVTSAFTKTFTCSGKHSPNSHGMSPR